MELRLAESSDLPLLARLNRQLIEDERHTNPMTLAQLQERMAGWLSDSYRAVLFEEDADVLGYALFRREEAGAHLRQFFVVRERRRQGLGRRFVKRLRSEILGQDTPVVLEVLSHNERALRFWRALGFVDHAVEMRSPPVATKRGAD